MLINFNFVWKWILLNYYFNSIILRNFCIVWTMYWNKICFSKLFPLSYYPQPCQEYRPSVPHCVEQSSFSHLKLVRAAPFLGCSNISSTGQITDQVPLLQKRNPEKTFLLKYIWTDQTKLGLFTGVKNTLCETLSLAQTSAYCHHFISILEFPSFCVYNFLRKG